MGKFRFAIAAIACAAAVGGSLALPVASSARVVPPPRPVTPPSVYKHVNSAFPIIGAHGPVIGVNLWAKQNYPAAQVRADGTRMLAYIKNVLHASAVDIVWNFFAPSYKGNAVEVTSATLTPSNVAILTQIAKSDHLLVEYRPMMFVLGVLNNWEGMIKPANPAQWFGNYYSQNLPYLRLAQQYQINEFVTGTEMDGVSRSPLWRSFLIKSAKVYKGVLSYADHQYRYFPPRLQLPPVGLVGLDDYEPLNLPPTATQAQVTAAYEHWFDDVPAALRQRTVLDETGIQARAYAYQQPSFMYIPGTLDPQIQVDWYTAACTTVKRFRMRGLFIWKVDLADNPAHPATSLSTFEGRAGAQAIGRCAAILAG